MNSKIIYYIIWIAIFPLSLLSQNFPGGVYGSEIWYIADSEDIDNGHYENHASNTIELDLCGDLPNGSVELGLMNFNPTIQSDKICISYRAPLESSSDKNFFIVTEPKDTDRSYPHISTRLGVFNEYVPPVDVRSENTYIIETNQGYGSRMTSTFEQYQNAHVYYYSWNNYDIEKKYKSYGQKGETTFSLGRSYGIPDVFEEDITEFLGLFPEYISFDRQLTKNERNRVESYLALKYGITKWKMDAYRSSQNIIFWESTNNGLFPNNIFGIGRDDISQLNQLVCESVHKKNYLIAATEQIIEDNDKMQVLFSIEDENFLVFGDNGGQGMRPPNERYLARLNKIWLAQITGDDIRRTPINFKLDVKEDFDSASIAEVKAGDKSVWMLHDRRAGNTEESDFDSNIVDYYQADPGYVLGPDGELFYEFTGDQIVFDQDRSAFDQFTFAIGPHCLVRFQAEYDCAEAERRAVTCYKLHVIVMGNCKEPWLVDENDKLIDYEFNEAQTELNGHNTYTAIICAPITITALLDYSETEPPLEFEYEAEVIGPYIVDLGPGIQYLNSQQTSILLDAGLLMDDPRTTFKWAVDGEVLYHNESTFLVERPGEYCVIVTTPDGLCEIKRCVIVLVSDLKAKIKCHPGLCSEGNSIEIQILSGLAPYTINIESEHGPQPPLITYTNSEIIEGLPTGFYSIIVTDSLGASFEDFCEFEEEGSGTVLSLGDDLLLDADNTQFVLDASHLGENTPDTVYQWSHNDEVLSIDGPHLEVTEPGTYTVRIYNGECYIEGIQIVNTVLDVSISQLSPCGNNLAGVPNLVSIEINFGFSPYFTLVEGINGTPAPTNIPEEHHGDRNFILENGDYLVTTNDSHGNSIQQEIYFTNLMNISLENQLMAYCTPQTCIITPEFCDTPYTHFDFSQSPTPEEITLEASLRNGSNEFFSFNWRINGIIVSQEDTLTLVRDQSCGGLYPSITKCEALTIELEALGAFEEYKACSFTEVVMIDMGWCLKIEAARGYASRVYPNPTDSEITFYYNILSKTGEAFEGRVEIFSILGSLIYSESIEGKPEYTLPYSLVASGVYLIKTTMADGTVTVDRVIIK